MQGLFYLGKSTLVSIWFRNGIDPNNNSGIQGFPHLDIPTKYQYLTSITTLIPTGRFFDTIIDVDY
jgi:hypothetical protein